MSADRSQSGPERTHVIASAPHLSGQGEAGFQLPPAEGSVTATPHFAGQDGAVPPLLLALLQEYAVHQGPIAEAQHKRRVFRIPALFGIGGGLLFVVCFIWMALELAGGLSTTRPPRSDPPWAIGMFFGGTAAGFIGLVWVMLLLEERHKVAAGEAGKADVMRRLLAAFPQLRRDSAEALLNGQTVQAITTRPANWAGVTLPHHTTE
jgi:hypothetical protein